MPEAKAKAKQAPKARVKLDRYTYLPTDLQRAAVFIDRADFLLKLQKTQHDGVQARLDAARPTAT